MRKATFVEITPKLLCSMGVATGRASEYAAALSQTMGQYDIMGPVEQAHFLGQVFTESDMLKWTEEIWGPTEAQRGYDTRQDLGNTPERDGDGKKYRGRGLIQVTGKDNYRRFRDHLRNHHSMRKPLLSDPSPVAEPPLCSICAGWYWSSNSLSQVASAGTGDKVCERVTEVVNGGHNHLKKRTRLTQMAHEELLKAGTLPYEKDPPVYAPESAPLEIETPHIPLDNPLNK